MDTGPEKLGRSDLRSGSMQRNRRAGRGSGGGLGPGEGVSGSGFGSRANLDMLPECPVGRGHAGVASIERCGWGAGCESLPGLHGFGQPPGDDALEGGGERGLAEV